MTDAQFYTILRQIFQDQLLKGAADLVGSERETVERVKADQLGRSAKA